MKALLMITFLYAYFCWGGSNCSSQTAKLSPVSKREWYKSDGHDIATEWYYPSNSAIGDIDRTKLRSLLIILHGSGGIEPEGGFFREMAQKISQKGNIVVIVHYLDRSNLEWASNSQMSANFQSWVHTIHDCVNFASKRPGVDPAKLSFFGHSLGAQLALHEAANDPRIHSIIDMAGCFVLPTASINRMPKILIWHGTADRVVPLAKEKAMVKVLERTHTKYKEEIFPGADHTFQKVDLAKLVKSATDFLNDD
jgi:predicted esterase